MRAVGEPAEPDLRALQVGQDGQRLAADLRGGPQPVVDDLVVGVVAVQKFIRATFIPASSRAAMPSSDEVAGPMVQTIFARRVMAVPYRL